MITFIHVYLNCQTFKNTSIMRSGAGGFVHCEMLVRQSTEAPSTKPGDLTNLKLLEHLYLCLLCSVSG